MFSLNIRAMKILYSAVTENDFEKIRLCSNAKDIWDTLNSLYASNDCVQVESNDSSSETKSCMSSMDEQLEVENEGEITENFQESVINDEQENEEEDSQEELTIDESDESCLRGQDTIMVNRSNSSCAIWKTNFDSTHKIVFQPIIDSILKSTNVLNHAGNGVGKKECSSMHVSNQHNICKSAYYKHHSVICNYCGKFGHISHTCFIRRNYNVRNKYVWVPKGQVRSNANVQGPKYKWVPKCPSSLFVQNEFTQNGHEGTEIRKKKTRVSHALTRRFLESTSLKRTLRAHIAGNTKSNHKQQWTLVRGTCTTSKMDYHKVCLNYLELNKERRISHILNRRLWKSKPHERLWHDPKNKHSTMKWVCKANPPST